MTADREDASDTMYLVTVPYTDIKNVQSALSSFAAQVVEVQLVQEAGAAIHETSGLHASVTSKTDNGQVKWADIGASLMMTTQSTLQVYQLLTFHYMCRIAKPKPRKQNGEVAVRDYHPPELVS